MFPAHDAPLTSGQRLALLLLTLVFPAALLGHALAYLWFRDTFPERARSFAWVGLTFLQGVFLVMLAVLAVQGLTQLLN